MWCSGYESSREISATDEGERIKMESKVLHLVSLTVCDHHDDRTPGPWLAIVISSTAGGLPDGEGHEKGSRSTIEDTATDVDVQSSTNGTTNANELNVSRPQFSVGEVMALLETTGAIIADNWLGDDSVVLLDGRNYGRFAAARAPPVLDIVVWLFLLDTTSKKCFVPDVRSLLEVRHSEDVLWQRQGSYERERTASAAGKLSTYGRYDNLADGSARFA